MVLTYDLGELTHITIYEKNAISADKTESDASEPYVGLKDPSCSFMNKNINDMYSGSK